MLNISENSIKDSVNKSDFNSYKILNKVLTTNYFIKITLVFFIIFIISLFLPWTQNVQSNGFLTTLNPSQKPQAIQSIISGRVEKWYVEEGSMVNSGDTILYLSEVKNEYMDPNLIERTSEQLNAKAQSVDSYEGKIGSLKNQIYALKNGKINKIKEIGNKIEQLKIKIKSDSIDLTAYNNDLQIAERQYQRTIELNTKGLKSLSDLEEKNLKLQTTQAKVNVQKNKIENLNNEILNLNIQALSAENEYNDKIAKAESDIFSTYSSLYEASGATSKLKNQLDNYKIRGNYYYVTAPQDGYVTKTVKMGIGEIVKEGTDIITIMPKDYDLAIEVYVRPQDLPLIEIGNKSAIIFDGWPAVVFSGWPNTSTGTFDGEVYSIDQFISPNGLYRVLIKPNEKEKEWPKLLVGSGGQAFMLLNKVPIWYELWRQLNGFPPDFYKNDFINNKKMEK